VDISPSAMLILKNYAFPENVRQLKGAMEVALGQSDPGTLILPHHLPKKLTALEATASQDGTQIIRIPQGVAYLKAREAVCRDLDRIVLGTILRKHNNNQSRAAEEAGIDRKTFSARIVGFIESQGDEPYA